MSEQADLDRIRDVRPLPGYKLVIAWDAHPAMEVDLSADIRRGGVFSALANQDLFANVKIGERRRTINWPVPTDSLGYPVIEIDADALYVMATEQRSGENLSSDL